MARPFLTQFPDPPKAEHQFTVISVDDHITEPPDVFKGRLEARFADQAPGVVEMPNGDQVWAYDDGIHFDFSLGNTVGRPVEEWHLRPMRYDEMRRACWDVDARVADMDLDGVWASMCFPSVTWGFAGRVFATGKDQELGLACTRAYNQWNLEEWSGKYPDRFIPCQLPWLPDPVISAQEIYKNAELGFKAVSFAEAPHRMGFPSILDAHWDPFFRACEETETVVCMHVGASGAVVEGSPGAALNVISCLFAASAMIAAVDWVWAGIPSRYPNLKIALSEGGLGWVPMAIDRLDHVVGRAGSSAQAETWTYEISPADVLRRNFWFCMINDPTALGVRDKIGIDHIMIETDYPHSDTTWPDTQAIHMKNFEGVGMPRDEIEKIAWRNAAELYRHPVPSENYVPNAVGQKA